MFRKIIPMSSSWGGDLLKLANRLFVIEKKLLIYFKFFTSSNATTGVFYIIQYIKCIYWFIAEYHYKFTIVQVFVWYVKTHLDVKAIYYFDINTFIDNKTKKKFSFIITLFSENNQCLKVLFVTVVIVVSLQILHDLTSCFDGFQTMFYKEVKKLCRIQVCSKFIKSSVLNLAGLFRLGSSLTLTKTLGLF